MKLVYTKYIPFKGFKAITLCPFIFVRKDSVINYNLIDDNHERIHGCQQIELLVVFFYIFYGIEWLINFCKYRNAKKAYKNISFEREAYVNERNLNYIKHRKLYSWINYI